MRQRLRLVVAGDVCSAIEDPGVALGDGAVKRDEFRVEITGRRGSDMKWWWRLAETEFRLYIRAHLWLSI